MGINSTIKNLFRKYSDTSIFFVIYKYKYIITKKVNGSIYYIIY